MGKFHVTELGDLEKRGLQKIYFHMVILIYFYKKNCQKVTGINMNSGQKSNFENLKLFYCFYWIPATFHQENRLVWLAAKHKPDNHHRYRYRPYLGNLWLILFILNQQNLHVHIQLHWVQWDIVHVHWHRSAFRIRAKVTFLGGVSLKSEEDLMGTEKNV